MRLDQYLVEKNFFDTRTKAKQAIERGEIYLNSKQITKCAFLIDVNKEYDIKYIYNKKFVSLGGYKLDKALTDFSLDCSNFIVADIGASTGGFTDCLLKHGAKKVYAVDLNDELLHCSLKSDSRVVRIIKNAKDLIKFDFQDELDMIVADLSFISATQVIKVFAKLLSIGKKLIILIKPQFEIGAKKKFKNGIVRDQKYRDIACKSVSDVAITCGFTPINLTTAPIIDGKNIEYLILLEKNV